MKLDKLIKDIKSLSPYSLEWIQEEVDFRKFQDLSRKKQKTFREEIELVAHVYSQVMNGYKILPTSLDLKSLVIVFNVSENFIIADDVVRSLDKVARKFKLRLDISFVYAPRPIKFVPLDYRKKK